MKLITIALILKFAIHALELEDFVAAPHLVLKNLEALNFYKIIDPISEKNSMQFFNRFSKIIGIKGKYILSMLDLQIKRKSNIFLFALGVS